MHRNKRRPRGCNDLLNHLVGGGLQRKRHGKAERLCGQAGAIRPPEIKLYRLSSRRDETILTSMCGFTQKPPSFVFGLPAGRAIPLSALRDP
jgi:hypothetical protein